MKLFFPVLITLFLSTIFSCNKLNDNNIIYIFKGDVITKHDFQSRYTVWLRKNGLADSYEMRKNFLYSELSDKLLYETGIKEGVEYFPEVKNKIDEFRKKTIIEHMKKRTRKELYSIDDEIVRSFYLENKDLFLREKLHRLYAVRLSSKKTAEETASQLRSGNSIRLLSARFSTDENLSRNNGDWGLFSEDVMDELWKKDVLSALPGEILGPYLDSENYYTIIEIAGYAYKRHLSFNRAYPIIVEKLIATQGSGEWDRYRDTMIRDYGAKINLDNLNWE
jgi:hypothetical protein